MSVTDQLQGQDRLHWLLGRLLHATARLDFCVGLQIRSLSADRGRPAKLSLAKQKLNDRLRLLQELTEETFCHSDPLAKSAFDEWFGQAADARALRNDYAHGRWGQVSSREPDLFSFIPLSWALDEHKVLSEQVPLTELQARVEAVESLTQRFMDLQEQFVHEARYTAAWENEHGLSPNVRPRPT